MEAVDSGFRNKGGNKGIKLTKKAAIPAVDTEREWRMVAGWCLVGRLESDTVVSVSRENGRDDGGYIYLRTSHRYLLITPSEVLITKGV